MSADTSTAAQPHAPVLRASRWWVVGVVACCLASLAAKWWVNLPRVTVNHGDIGFYFTVARNLAEGRGFVIDYVWNHWAQAEGIPTPSNVWWMPLPSVIAAVGMRLGDMDYVSAQAATIAFSSLLPIPMYLLGRDVFGSRAVGLAGAALGSTFHIFLDQPSAPLSHCPYVVFASLTLWAIHRAVGDPRPRRLFLVGACVAFTQLSRSDGILLFGTLAAAYVVAWKRPPLKAVALLVLGYALVMSPWWGRNLQVHGALMPGGSFRSVYMRSYFDWYRMPESVTAERFLADGWGPVWEAKANVTQINLESLGEGMVTGGALRDKAWDEPWIVATWVLSWLGVLACIRRRFAFIGLHALGELTFYSLIFTEVARESFRSGMFSLYPFLVLCVARAVQLLAQLVGRLAGARHGPRLATAVFVGVIGLLGWQHLVYGRDTLEHKARGILRGYNSTARVVKKVIEPLGLSDATFMVVHAHNVYAMMGLRCVGIPYEPEPVLREVAARYGATHVLVLNDTELEMRPALKRIANMPRAYALLEGPVKVGVNNVRVYEIL